MPWPTTSGPLAQGARPAGQGSHGRRRGAHQGHESQEIARLLMLEAKDPHALDPEQARYLEGPRSSTPEFALAQDLAGRFARSCARERKTV